MPRGLELGTGSERVLVLLPGFITSARAYTGLVSPLVVSDPGLRVVVPQLYGIGPGVLANRYPVAQEARDAAHLVGDLATSGVPVWLAGHSRGGQAAWLAAEELEQDHPASGPGPDRPGGQLRSPIGSGAAPAVLHGMPGDRRRDQFPLRPRGGEPPAVRHLGAAPDPRHSPGMRPRRRAVRSCVALGPGPVRGRPGPAAGPRHGDRPDRRPSARRARSAPRLSRAGGGRPLPGA